MSTLLVDVNEIAEVVPHPNADRLEKVRVKNWWVITQKDTYQPGDKVVYFPPDSVISEELGEKFGITKYCQPLKEGGLRVRAARLRGESSFGFVTRVESNWNVGENLVEHYGVKKYEPPINNKGQKTYCGESAPPLYNFRKYTDIENYCNYPGILQPGERIIVEEKLHGTNCAIGRVFDGVEWAFVASSHNVRRKEFDANGRLSRYWEPMESLVPRKMLFDLCDERRDVVVYGEIYGPGVQDMHYGLKQAEFRIFDITIDGRYLDYGEQLSISNAYGLQRPPFIYDGAYTDEILRSLVDGPTLVSPPEQIKQPFKGREGIVIRPAKERFHPDIGRVILKFISADYYSRKNPEPTEAH